MNHALAPVAAYVLGGSALAAVESRIVPQRKPRSPIAPPAAAFGIAWSLLFTGLGIARARLDAPRRHRVDRLWLLCATYPLYTLGNHSRVLSYVGNALVAATAARTAADAARRDDTAALLIGAIVPWAAYATLILMTERRR